MATDKLINQSQGDDIINALDDIATNLGNISYGEQTSADKVVAMTGYEKASTASSITQADTLNEAVGKLEKKVDDNATAINSKVSGPNESYTDAIAIFGDTTGKTLANSEIYIETEELTEANNKLPTCEVVENALFGVAGTLSDRIDDKLDKTANAASAAKLNNGSTDYEVGSATKGVYFDDGIPKAMTCSVETNVPQNAVFTDTTYSNGTGISINSSNQINHSNSVTKQDTASALKVAYDAQGHITGSSALAASDISAVPTSRTVNSKALSDNIALSGDDIKLTSYTKGTSTDAVAATDKVNEAIAKHENRIDANKNNILYTLNRTGKNLLNTPSVTISGKSWNTDSDGYITAADTTGDSRALNYDNCQYYCHLHSGTYKLVVDIKTSSSTGSAIAAIYSKTGTISTNNLQNKTGVQVYEFIISTEDDYGVLTKLYAGSWRIMICEADMYTKDSSYVPYALPNSDLTRLESEDRAALVDVVDSGAKNLVEVISIGGISSNINVTVNSDKSIKITGDGSMVGSLAIVYIPVYIPAGTYVLSGCPSGANYEYGYTCDLRDTNNSVKSGSDTGNGAEFTLSSGGEYRWCIRLASTYTIPSGGVTFKPMICTKAQWNISHAYEPYALPNSELTSQLIEINQLVRDTQPIYGYRIAKNNLDPDTRVEYLFDAVGMTPAYMNFSTGQFNYGSWGDIWFIKNNKPVALNFDGTEAFELNPTNYWQKSDGTTAIDIEDASLNYNYMSRIPTVYVKRWEDSQYNYVAFTQYPQGGFTAYAHQGASGRINENIYLPMFKGFKDSNGKLRSLAGKTPWNTTGGVGYELDAAKAIATTNNGWQIWDFAKHELISDLLTLISKNTSSRWKFGKGVIKTASSTAGFCKGGYEYDGTTKATCAQFWGTDEGTGNTPSTEDGSHHVRVFHIEDLWGNRWDRCLGLHLINGIYKVKMFAPYYATAPTGSGALLPDETYETLSLTPPSGNYLQNQSTGFYGNIPISTSGDKNKGYCSYFWQSSGADRLLIFGGRCVHGFDCSARSLYLSGASVRSYWDIGASPCFNHL